MILVLLGTQNNSFYRLLEEVQKCIDEDIIKDKVIVQAGSTKFESKDMEVFNLIEQDKFNILMEQADTIITHGGVGSIVTAVKLGKKVIAVPRLKQYGEHVNDHQIQIVETFSNQGFIKGIKDVSELIEIKGNEKDGYYLDFIDGIDDKLNDIVKKYNKSSEYHNLPKDINFLKKIIKAEVVTQFPNLAGKVSSDSKDGFQGAVEIRRVTPNKELRRNEKYWKR